MRLGCCEVYLVNEGNLNNDKASEISVFQAPKGRWTKLIPMFLIPTFCDPFTEEDLEKKVFKENGKVYYWETEVNDEDHKPLKKSVKIN